MFIRESLKSFSKLIIIGLLILSLTGCGTTSATMKAGGPQAIPVQTSTVEIGDLSNIYTLTGTITPNLQTIIGSKLSGRVLSVNVDVAQTVRKGQVLAELDPVDLQRLLSQNQAQLQVDHAQLASDQATFAQAQIDFQRYQTLYNDGAASQSDLEQYHLKMNTAGAKVQMDESTINKDQSASSITQQQIDELTISSPVDGTVSIKNIEIGEQISPSTNLFTIVQVGGYVTAVNAQVGQAVGPQGGFISIASMNPLMATVDVPENLIGKMKAGQDMSVFVASTDETLEGKVNAVHPVPDPTSKNYSVDITLTPGKQQVLPGMQVEAHLTNSNKKGIVVPADSIITMQSGALSVFVVQDGKAVQKMVKVGSMTGSVSEVTSGLQPGDAVVIKGQNLLSNGDAVQVTATQNAEPSAEAGQAGGSSPGVGGQ